MTGSATLRFLVCFAYWPLQAAAKLTTQYFSGTITTPTATTTIATTATGTTTAKTTTTGSATTSSIVVNGFELPTVLPHANSLPVPPHHQQKQINKLFFLFFLLPLLILAVSWVAVNVRFKNVFARYNRRQRVAGDIMTQGAHKLRLVSLTWFPRTGPESQPIDVVAFSVGEYFVEIRINGSGASRSLSHVKAARRWTTEARSGLLWMDKEVTLWQDRKLDSLGTQVHKYPNRETVLLPNGQISEKGARARPERSMVRTDFQEVWALPNPKPCPRGSRIAWILESVDVEGQRKNFLARIEGEFIAISGIRGQAMDSNQFGAVSDEWDQSTGRWKNNYRFGQLSGVPCQANFDIGGIGNMPQGSRVTILGREYIVRASVSG